VLNRLEKELGLDRTERRAVIQGFGNAGAEMAHLLHEGGWKILAVSDSGGAVCDQRGLDPVRLMEIKREKGSVTGYLEDGHESVCGLETDELFAMDCDLVVPAAMEDQITEDNAGGVRAAVVLELANGPVTAAADHILEKNGVQVVPDILANAGGVTVSYFEWVQNRQGWYWTKEEVQNRLKPLMESEAMAVWAMSRNREITLRTAAYVVGLQRLADAIKAHGTQSYFCP
jgi:glutamate dehydrogenase (NADP+)